MDPNGNMLRIARQRRRFHQTEAAKKLGIDQPLLSRVENGMAEFREEALLRAARLYDVPRSFFFLTDPIYGAPVSVHPMWRRKVAVSVRELDGVVAELNIRVMHLRRLLQGADIAHSNDLPRLDIDEYGDPKRVAALVRAHWCVPRGPLPDLTLLLEKAGILVAHSPLGGASISGVTFSVPGMPPFIVLNSEQPADRMRYTLAHELGHLVMHRFPTPAMEEEANMFASALLLPASDIRTYFIGRRIDLSLLGALKPEWRVSMQALLMSASEIVPLSANQKQYLWKQMSARGYRLREPPELDFERELPTVISDIIKVHERGLGYSREELSHVLHINLHEFSYYYPSINEDSRKPRLTIMR